MKNKSKQASKKCHLSKKHTCQLALPVQSQERNAGTGYEIQPKLVTETLGTLLWHTPHLQHPHTSLGQIFPTRVLKNSMSQE